MNRRAFAIRLSLLGLGVASCGGDAGAPVEPPPPPPPPPPPEPASPGARALATAAGLVASAEAVGDGVRWRVFDADSYGYRTDLYSGQAGVLTFLAETYRTGPTSELRGVLERGGRFLRQTPASTQALYEGRAGHAWALLSLHEALGGTEWLDAALALAPGIAAGRAGLVGDIINGLPGQGLLLLRLHSVAGDARWLQAARSIADSMLERAVPVGDGLKFPSFVLQDGRTVYYTGLSHGTAGAGYFLARLARALPGPDAGKYLDGAEAAARWLDGVAIPAGPGVNWYRREPDQMQQQQVQWCHGAPGIGLFYAELYAATRNSAQLETALRCAVTVERDGIGHHFASLCHGVAGNAGLFFKLFRETGERDWLRRAESFGEVLWAKRIPSSGYPAWPSADGYNTNNPGLMTGTAGPGWFWLQLAREGALGMPVTS
jgi:lantibiotic modifying enzyme